MGMAASQARFLGLTSRKADIELENLMLSNQKTTLARDMQKVSREYQDALNSKVLKWSSNQGASYVDLSYKNLMTPSLMNQNSPYLLTDMSGKVVVDEKYHQYAQMISPDGVAGGDWESNRTKILSSLTGIDANKINSVATYKQDVYDKQVAIEEALAIEPDNYRLLQKSGIEGLLDTKLGSGIGVTDLSFSSGANWLEAYENEATINLGDSTKAYQNLSDILTHNFEGLAKYFPGKEDIFKTVLEDIAAEFKGQDTANLNGGPVTGSPSGYKLDVKVLIDTIMSKFKADGGDFTELAAGTVRCDWYDVDSDEYKQWQAEHDKWQTEIYDPAVKAHEEAVKNNNQLLTADEERQIAFYDAIFSSIAQKGWVVNYQVEDTDYLNQMLQNNLYTLTEVDREEKFDKNSEEYYWENSYSTDIASNFTNVFSVKDSDAVNEALIEYENKKRIISTKESRIDTRMLNLQTELSAINQMLQSIEQVKNDNIERTFGTFG